MNTLTVPEAFARCDFARHVSAESLHALADITMLREFNAGAVIFREGARINTFYLILSGEVALDVQVLGRGSQRILSLGPDEFLAWSAFLADARMTATAIALSATQTLAMPAAELAELCERDSHLGYHLMRSLAGGLSRRLTTTRMQLLDLFTPPRHPPLGGTSPGK